jgi:hypothetical protein
MAETTIVQKIILKVEEFSASLKKATADTKTATDDMNKAMTGNSKVLSQNEEQVKKWGKSVGDELSKVGEKFVDNLKTGAKAMTLDAGRDAIKQAGRDAVGMAFHFSKAFAEIKSRSNASSADLEKWQRSLMQTSANVGANMDSMAESFKDMFSSVSNPDELLKIMDSVGKAAAMGDGDTTKVSNNVMGALKGQGKEVNKTNVDEYLHSADVLRRHSQFGSMDESMGAMSSMNQAEVGRSGLSQRELANAMAAMTATSDKTKGVAGLSALMHANDNGLTEGSVLASILGTGHSLSGKDGKFDISKLQGKYGNLLKMGGGTDKGAMEVFKKVSGLSGNEAEGIVMAMKNSDKLGKELASAANDTKTFAKSAEEGADNLEQSYKKFENGLILGVTDILGGFQKPLKALLSGDIGGAISGSGSALSQAGSGIMNHKALVAGAIGTTAIAGSLITSLIGKIGGPASTAVGVAKGKALQAAGVQPVFVVNASEIGGGGGGLGAAAGGMGFMGKLGLVGGAGALGYAAGSALEEYSTEHGSKNKYGQKSSFAEKGLAKLLPEWAGGMTKEQYHDSYDEAKPQKVEVEIKLEADGFSARPTSKGMNRDGRNH